MFNLAPDEFVIGLGSNSDNAISKFRLAKQCLQSQFHLLACSPIYSSDALLPDNAPENWNRPFLNAALRLRNEDNQAFSTTAQAHSLLLRLKQIEQALGRLPGPRWSPRVIDLDILAWGGPQIQSEELTIPHRELLERPFALLPDPSRFA